jgi:hypothetical protein
VNGATRAKEPRRYRGLTAAAGLSRWPSWPARGWPARRIPRGVAAPRVLPAFRHGGVGTLVLHALAAHLCGLGLPTVRVNVGDEGSLAFAGRFGFTQASLQVICED